MARNKELWSRYRKIEGMPYGRARTLASQSLLHDAESEEDLEFLPVALLNMVESYRNGESEVFAVFAQTQKLYHDRPELFSERDLWYFLWLYKWMGSLAAEFPQVSRSQIDAFLTDMETHYRITGHPIKGVLSESCRAA